MKIEEAVHQKVCTRCNTSKHCEEFRLSRNKRSSECKACLSERSRKWRQENPLRAKESSKRSRTKHAEQRRADNALWRANNAENLRRSKAEYYQRTKERDRERKNAYQRVYEREKRKSDTGYAINERISRAIRGCLAGSEEKQGRAWQSLVGYSLEQLIKHLEAQFLPRMSWENRSLWHIDHIVPLSSFNITSVDSEEFRAAWALSNLRPLWAEKNIQKKNRREFLL